jgi:hypothetical protein
MATSATYYLNGPSLGSSTAIFSDAALTTLADDGFYSDGLIVREQVLGVLLPQQTCDGCVPESYNCVEGSCVNPGDGTGTYETLLECEASCSSGTVQVSWTLNNIVGGRLIIYNNSMVELLNVASFSEYQSGTIYPLITELPYTVRGQWNSGSGNIVRYNICNGDSPYGTIFTSGAIDNMTGYVDYTVTPTPDFASVNLTSGNVTPLTCYTP